MGLRCCSKQKVRKGLWSPDEDEKLIRCITAHGHSCWSSVPKQAGLQRCGKSCRLRWINYLRPNLKRGSFTVQEERIIIAVHRILGNRWAQIAKHLPGRTDNEVKNYWNSCVKKKLMAQGLDPATHNLMTTPAMVTRSTSNSSSTTSSHGVPPAPFTISNRNSNYTAAKSNNNARTLTTMFTRDAVIENYYNDSSGASHIHDPTVEIKTGPPMYGAVTTPDALASAASVDVLLTLKNQPSNSSSVMGFGNMCTVSSPTQEKDHEVSPTNNSSPTLPHALFQNIVGGDPTWESTMDFVDIPEVSIGCNFINFAELPTGIYEETGTPTDLDVTFSNFGFDHPLAAEFDLLHCGSYLI